MRIAATISCLVAVLVLSGCAPGANGELQKLVDAAAPSDSSLNCEWGSSTFENEPKSWYGCWNSVPGDLERVARTYKSRLVAQGFVVSYRSDSLSVELTGVRGVHTLCIDVLGPGFLRGRNTSPSEVKRSRGQVFVDVWALERRDAPAGAAIAPCAPIPAFPEY